MQKKINDIISNSKFVDELPKYSSNVQQIRVLSELRREDVILADGSNSLSSDWHTGDKDITVGGVLQLEKVLILPRLTTSQRNSINPIAGMIIFNITTSTLNVYDGSSWKEVNMS